MKKKNNLRNIILIPVRLVYLLINKYKREKKNKGTIRKRKIKVAKRPLRKKPPSKGTKQYRFLYWKITRIQSIIIKVFVFLIAVLIVIAVIWGVSSGVGFFLGKIAKTDQKVEQSGPFKDCTSKNLKLQLSISPNQIQDSATITKTFTHISDLGCLVNLGGKGARVDIYNSDRTYWTTGECDDTSREVLLGEGDSVSQNVEWKVNSTCKTDRVPSGTYNVKVTTKNNVVSNEVSIKVL
jgi:hypothetical protein